MRGRVLPISAGDRWDRRPAFLEGLLIFLRYMCRRLSRPVLDGGAEGIRTPDPHNAIVVLYQLSYDPIQSPNTLNG